MQAALYYLPWRRPDLLALQAGYQSQQAKLRRAILAQFPALTIGFNTARDTSAVYTHGLSIGITGRPCSTAIAATSRSQLGDAPATARRLCGARAGHTQRHAAHHP
ncbi:hypothetical protein [Rhodanobacter lindaniclasticus]